MTIRALLLDFGGVLVELHWDRAFRLWSERSGVPAADIAARFGPDEAWRAHERGALDDAAFFVSLRSTLGIALDDADMLAGWNAIFGEPYPGTAALLGRLTLPVYVLSNTNPAHLAHFRPRYRELLSPVKQVFSSCDLGARKPEPEAFLKAAAQIGMPPAAILFIDDLAENVAGAQSAGLQARHAATPANLAPILAPWAS